MSTILSVVIISVIMLSVIMLSVIMVIVVALYTGRAKELERIMSLIYF